MPFAQAEELDILDYRTAKLSGMTFRAHAGVLPAGEQTLPSGTKLSEFPLPDPSHNAAAWDVALGKAVATMRSTWAQQAASAGGTFGCFVIVAPGTSGTPDRVVQRGTMGRALTAEEKAAGQIPPQVVVSAATIAAGAPFSIIEYTIRQAPMP